VSGAYIIAARRTAVAPRNGAFRAIALHDLAAPVLRAVLADAGIERVDEVILGNGLYGGGNPARVAALVAGLPEDVPALTLDTQCCAGLDAIRLAAARVVTGEAETVLAGGCESFSRAPLRFRRPVGPDETPEEYRRPPFTPWRHRDPDMVVAAAALARELDIARAAQETFAIASHRTALASDLSGEIVAVDGLAHDAFARHLDARICARLPVVEGDALHGVTAATIAVEADAAAAVLVVSERVWRASGGGGVQIAGGMARGGDPVRPGLAPIAASKALLQRLGLNPHDLVCSEIMEAFAVQAMTCIQGIGLDPGRVNVGGGALARGHPIGASGAILAVRLFHELRGGDEGAAGLAAIAAAGGLGSALVLTSTG
jgi:acetyl-CoA C-acetyltransferase